MSVLAKAVGNALETLENRQLMAAVALPLRLDFNASVSGTILDKQGRGTGFAGVQANKNNDQYQPTLINVDTAAGVLKLTTRGTSLAGSATGTDNTLANGLESAFNGNQRNFSIDARLIGPLSNLVDRYEQAGIYFGPDQDHFVKLVPGRNYEGQFLSFEDEFLNASGGITSTRNGPNAQTAIGSFASINTIDLRIVGDALTGKLSAYYRINSDTAGFTKVGYDITIAPDKVARFFNAESKAGIIAIGKSDTGAITATFDSFGITAGTPILARPSVQGLEGISSSTSNIRRDATLKALLTLANDSSPIDVSTFNSSNIRLFRAGDGAVVTATLSLAADSRSFTIDPNDVLDPNTTYTVQITDGLKDQAGAAFQPFTSSFTTGTATGSSGSTTGPQASFSIEKLYFSDIKQDVNGGTSLVQKIRITNTGVANLVLGTNAFVFGGTHGSEFQLGGNVTLPATIEPGGFFEVPVVFKAGTTVGIRAGTLTINSNDPAIPAKTIQLRGLATAGTGGDLEPSLQRIMDLYQIPVNVGDSTPDTTDYPSPPTSGEAIDIGKLIKAGSGPVTIEVLANFANNTLPISARFGYYSPGSLAERTRLYSVERNSGQAIRPVTSGNLSFEPNGEFGLFGEFPAFDTKSAAGRVVTSEKDLNTWESNTARRQKVRFFPLKNADGTVVPNAYVFTFEEWNVGYDQNDIVGIIRNVAPAAAGPEIGTTNLDVTPYNDRLVMSRIRDIQVADSTQNYIPNTVHDRSTLRVTNSGDQTLNVSSVSISNGDFIIFSGGGAFSLAPGATRDIVVQFVFNRTGDGQDQRNATLTLNSNDADEPAKTVQLSGLWQSHSENNPSGVTQEPTAAQILTAFGYKVAVGVLGGDLAAIRRAGEEILSEMWQIADRSNVAQVIQLAAYHQQKSTTESRIRYKPAGVTGVGTTIFAHIDSDGQTLLPRPDPANPAREVLESSVPTTFSWTVDSNQSIDSANANARDGGHSLRFYAAKDLAGKIIPNTYLLLMDYVGQSFSNYDYQDNIYLLTNVRPVSGALAPENANATTNGNGNALSWTKNPEGNVVGYNIYRSANGGGYIKINGDLVTGNAYTDTGASVGTNYSYQIRPVDYHGTEGSSATVSITRTSDTVAPATPNYPTSFGQTGGISLNWLDNTEGDLAGYNVYRASTIDGTYVKLNSALLTSSDYLDLSAPGAATSYYRITAIDTAGNESNAASLNAYRPANGDVPAAPSGLSSPSFTANSITLSWSDNSNNESGFIIERRNADGTFSQIGTTGANVTTFNATSLQGGTSYVFRVRATNASGASAYSNEHTASTTQSAPVAASNLAAVALNSNSVRLTWTDNAANETGYRIERRIGSGAWIVIETVGTNATLYTDQSAAANTAYSYQVIAVNAAGSSPASNIATVTTPAADGYQSVNVGSPSAAGSTNTISAGKDYDITAGGTDIWGTADQFRYVYKSVTGDFDYSVRMIDVSQADIGSMGGLMARESLSASSRHIFMRARAQGLRANYRLANGGTSVGVGEIPFAYPNAYVRLQRVGNTFTAYGSVDGANWTIVTQQTMAMPTTILFGMAANARTTTTATTVAKFRDLTDRKVASTPNAPTNLVGSADPATPSVSLAWSDNATNETGYRVERRVAGSSIWTTVATLGASVTSHLDSTVAINTQYVYRVFATNAAGSSAPTAELVVTVANGVPAAPTNLSATNVASGIQLAWTDNSSNETNFHVERRLGDGTWASLVVLNANVTTYTDASVTAGTSYGYRVRALGASADSGYSNEATITSPAALSFTSVDIGGAPGGSTQVIETGSDYNITAGGTDVWNSSDQFRFVYRQVTGNFDIRVRVAGIAMADDQSMAGLMARASLDANSRNVYAKVRANGTHRMTYRSSTGGTTTGVGSGTATFPNGWVRLVRSGNTFTGYSSTDGATWTVISTVTLSLPTTMFVGMAAASHVTNVTSTAQFRDLTLA